MMNKQNIQFVRTNTTSFELVIPKQHFVSAFIDLTSEKTQLKIVQRA